MGIEEDPGHPMYYYNLAGADAKEKNLAEACSRLQEAFIQKANVRPGESMPDPTNEGSLLPYRNNKDFWIFQDSLPGEPHPEAIKSLGHCRF